MRKKSTLYIHRFTGLFSALFILLMSLSGAALVFRVQLDNKPHIKTSALPVLTVDSCYRVIQKNYPAAQISNCSLPESEEQAFSFVVYDSSYRSGTKGMEVFLHPQTGQVLMTRGGSDDLKNNFMSWLSKFHNSFHLGKTGEWLLGFFALLFLLSLATGIILFRKSILPVLLFHRKVYSKRNLHQLIGVYALLFNLMIAVTGFWMQRYVFKKDFYSSYDYKPVLNASPALSFSFDSAYRAIKQQHPGFTAYVIYFAQNNKGKTAVYGSRSSNAFVHSKKFADAIMLDSDGAVAGTRFVTEISSNDRYDIINSQVHMGNFGGLTIKLIYFIFGLSGSLLSITGFLLWARKRNDG